MEMSLFNKYGETWTKFRVSISQLWAWKEYLKDKYGVDTSKPIKQNSRYIYFEAKGDFLNINRR